jgi:replicative DNA helicase
MSKRNVYASVLKKAMEDATFRSDVLRLSEDHFPEEFKNIIACMKLVSDPTEQILTDQLVLLGHDPSILDTILAQASSTSHVSDLTYIIDQKNKKDFYMGVKDILRGMNGKSYSDTIDDVRKLLSTAPAGKDPLETGEIVAEELLDDIMKFRNGEKKPFLSTGLKEFDEKARLYKNKYVLFASQKKQGKTKFAINLSQRLMKYNKNVSVLYISLEMTKKEIVNGYLSLLSGITEDEIFSNKNPIKDEDLENLKLAINEFGKYDFKIYSSPMALKDLYQVCSEFCSNIPKDNIPVIVIDNIGLIRAGKKSGIEFDDEIAIALKDIRDDFGCLLLAIHHMTKSSENDINTGYEPRVQHVRGSSRLADFCNTLIMAHRPGAYEDLVKLGDENGVDVRDMFLINVALQRGGQGGYVPLYCDLSRNRFYE